MSNKKDKESVVEKCTALGMQCIDLLQAAELSPHEGTMVTSFLVGITYESIINGAKEKMKGRENLLKTYIRNSRREILRCVMDAMDYAEEVSYKDEEGGEG